MRSPIAWFAEHRVAANLLMVAIVTGGALTLPTITREVFPDVTPDLVTVSVAYPGAAPDEVERAVVERIEERIEDVIGIRRITSSASEGAGVVTAELDADADPQRSLEQIKTRIDGLTSLPDEVEDPVVERPLIRRHVIDVAVAGAVGERARKDAAERIRDEIAALPGITQAEVVGVRRDEISIDVSEAALRRHRLAFDDVADAIRRSSVDLPGGVLETDDGEIRLRTFGEARTRSDFARISLVSRSDGTRLTLGDVATVNDGFEEDERSLRFDGEPAALVRVYRVGRQSALGVSEAVRDYVASNADTLPPGLSMSVADDGARILQGRIDTLMRNARSGLLLVLLCLTLFLAPRLAFWVSAGIPIAFLGALWIMPSADVSLNLVSLFAFILVLGILVDDSIVVGENVHRRRRLGDDPMTAAVEGTREVATPVTFGVLTTVVAFAPLLMVEGASGVIWRQIPVVVIAALLFSLVKCYLVLPAHLAHPGRFRLPVPARWRGERSLSERVGGALERAIERFYRPALEAALRARYAVLAAGVAAIVVCVSAIAGGWIRFTFFPPVENDEIVATFELPPGTPFQRTREIAALLESTANTVRDRLAEEDPAGRDAVDSVIAAAGDRLGRSSSGIGSGDGTTGSVEVALVASEARGVSATEFARRWRAETGRIPDVIELTFASELFSAGDAIDVELRGTDVEALRRVALGLRADLEGRPGVSDVRDSYRAAKDEFELRLRPEAEGLGLSTVDLARQVRQAFYGEEAQRISRGGEDVKVMVRYPRDQRRALGDVERLRIRTPQGDAVPLSVVADVRMGEGPATIRRANGARVVNVRADVDIAVTSAAEVLGAIRAETLPDLLRDAPGVSFALEGEQREQRESLAGLGRGLLYALLGIFTLLAIPLRSYVQPLLVMATIPLGAVGAVAGHAALGLPLSFPSVIGMTALAGVVVNDSLVWVDWANRSVREGMAVREAAVDAGLARFRPVFLTSLTTCLGLLPLLLEQSVQAQFLVPMAVSIAAGVVVATLVSLIVVPSAFLCIADARDALRHFESRLDLRTPDTREAP